MIDSGFRRGSDVLKALALGADAVWLGRAARWALGAFGPVGVQTTADRDHLQGAGRGDSGCRPNHAGVDRFEHRQTALALIPLTLIELELPENEIGQPTTADASSCAPSATRELTASIINVTIASSIFLMPATAAAGLGAAAPIAYLVCATLMTLIALCFAAAGSRVSLTGGLYAYIEIAFGGFAGFLGGFLYSLTACLSVASVATAFAGSAGVLWPTFAGGPLARSAAGCCLPFLPW